MKFSSLTDRVKGAAADAWDLHYLAKDAKSRGDDVIVLSVGDPDFTTPQPIVDKAIEALRAGDTHYTQICGHDELRRAIAIRHRQTSGQAVTAEQVIATSGAQNALFSTALCLLDPGDEAIVLQPMYVTYEATVQASGATLVPLVLDADDGFRLNAGRLRAAISERTRAIFYASPSNPTGIALNSDEIKTIAAVAREHDLWVVADEVYADFVFNGDFHHISAEPGMDDRVVSIGSMSKSYAMSGWRLGWAIAPFELISNLEKLALCMLYGLPGFIMQASQYALEHCAADSRRMRDVYRRRLDYLYHAFSALPGLHPHRPDAGMFLLVDVRGTGLSSAEFCRRLYDGYGVSVLEATPFGTSAAGHVRVSCTVGDDELAEACSRIDKFIAALG